MKSICRKPFLRRRFFKFLLFGDWTIDLRSKLRDISERALEEPSNALFRSAVALLVPELCADVQKNVENGEIWPLVTSGDLTFDLTLKLTEVSPPLFFTLFRCMHLPRVAMWLRSRVRGRRKNAPLPSTTRKTQTTSTARLISIKGFFLQLFGFKNIFL